MRRAPSAVRWVGLHVCPCSVRSTEYRKQLCTVLYEVQYSNTEYMCCIEESAPTGECTTASGRLTRVRAGMELGKLAAPEKKKRGGGAVVAHRGPRAPIIDLAGTSLLCRVIVQVTCHWAWPGLF